jgi:hypothetical protein
MELFLSGCGFSTDTETCLRAFSRASWHAFLLSAYAVVAPPELNLGEVEEDNYPK